MFNWLLEDKKEEPVFKFLPKIVITNKSTLYVQVEPKDPTTTSNITITAFASQQVRSIIPIRVEWSRFKIKSESAHATEKIHCLAGNTYMCEPGDVGGYIKAVVRSVEQSIKAEAQVVIGPIGIDVMVKRVIDGSLYAGNLLSQVVICERQRKNNVTVRLYSRTIQFVDDVSQQKLVKEYSISEPKIELNPKDPTRVYFRFEHDQNNTVRQWLNKIFNLESHPSLEQSSLSIRIPYSNRSSNSSKMRLFQKSHGPCPNKFEMRFISRLSRDLFLFTQRAFVCRQDMKNSIYIQRIQSLQNLATEHDYHKFLEYTSLKMEICRIAEYAKEVEEDRDAKVKDLIAMQESIGQMTLTYLKIIEEKGKREKIDFEQSYSQINNTRQQYLNRKNMRQLKSQNENLKQRLRQLNEEIDLLKFFKKQDNQSMIFNQTTNPFAKKNNQNPFNHSPDKSAIKGVHQLSLNYANLLEENRILKSENKHFKNQMMSKNPQNKILDHSQNMIELLGSLDEREQREARQAKLAEYEQTIIILRRENDQIKRRLNDITQGQSKIRGLGVTKQSRYCPQEEPSFINNQSIINQTANLSMNSNASSFMNNSMNSEAAMAKLQDNLANLSKINAKLQQDNSRVRKERQYYRNEFNKMRQYIKQFENGNANTNLEDSRMHSSQITRYRQQTQQLQNQKNALMKKLQSISRENSQGLRQQYLLREKKIKELEQTVERLSQENKKLSRDSDKENKVQKIQGLTNQNNKLKKINSQLLEEIKNLKMQLQQIRDEENMYNSRVIELQNELNFAKINNSLTSNQQHTTMLAKINQLAKENAKLKQQIEQKTIKLQSQSGTIDKLMREHTQVGSQKKHSSSLSSTNSKQKCYSQKCNQSTIEQLQKYKREVKKLQEEIIFMKKSSDAINRSRDLTLEMDGYYQQKMEIMRKEMDALYLQNENLSKMCERYGKDAREANKQLMKCKQKIMSLMKSKHEDSSLLIQ